MAEKAGQFSKSVVTQLGKGMIVESQNGKILSFTRVALGDGLIEDGEDIEKLTSIKKEKLSCPIRSFVDKGNGQFALQFEVSNAALEKGFWHREIGVMAKIGAGAEQLYAYSYAGTAASFLYDKTTPIQERIVKIDVVVGNTENLTVVIDSSIIHPTMAEVDARLTEHNESPNAHQDIREAITAFVAQAMAALVNSAPGALDTLQELAAALGNDANFAATVTNALAGKLGKTETAARAAELVGWSLERNRAYSVGDVAYHRSLPSWARLECVRAGTTAGSMPNLAVSQCGVMITDGSVVWIIDDVRDSTPVGSVRGAHHLPDGYIKANGATVLRADYPRLVEYATRTGAWTSYPQDKPGLFGVGDGSTTMTLPNWTERIMQFTADGEPGIARSAGLPNIRGSVTDLADFADESNPVESGALSSIKKTITLAGISNVNQHREVPVGINFDASKSNLIYGGSDTVQPAAITMMPVIKY